MTPGNVEELEGVGRYRRFGEGPPVVILSNPLANPDLWAARHVDALVAAGYQATTFVHIGAEHHYHAVTRDVVEFLASLGSPPVRLLGWSQGAAIAQEVALAASELVACAALIATYGRQNHFDRILQDAWAELDRADAELANLRLAMLFLTGEPPQLLGDDDYLNDRIKAMRPWATQPRDGQLRRRSRAFVNSYQDRLDALRNAPPDGWVAFSADETRLVAYGVTYEEAVTKADQNGERDPVLVKVPKDWSMQVLSTVIPAAIERAASASL